jgi:hypothetical protein
MLAQNENLADQLRDLRVIHSFASTLLHFSDSIDDILWDLAQQETSSRKPRSARKIPTTVRS